MPVTNLTADEARPRLAEFDVIIDVRTKGEWDQGHLELASVRHVENLHTFPEKVSSLSGDVAGKRVLVHCGVGKRAVMAGRHLEPIVEELFMVNSGGYAQLK